MLVSNVSIETCNSHGGLLDVVDSVRLTSPRMVVRPDAAVLAKGRAAEKICPLVTVNGVAATIAEPLLFRNEIIPAQDAAVPLELLLARLTTLICAVSELANPMGENGKLRVTVLLLVCADRPPAAQTASASARTDRRRDTLHLSG